MSFCQLRLVHNVNMVSPSVNRLENHDPSAVNHVHESIIDCHVFRARRRNRLSNVPHDVLGRDQVPMDSLCLCSSCLVLVLLDRAAC